ncbi:MAG: thiamine biosynthesis lipoprotein [Fusobacteria bacterium]|nr:MAG: thiamine biosynthesis lipoprotein [Fusobacteriota bacterium]KAF0229658.1 MAG: thiamine biosynthesis [Fusobacteriota bacterium]
MLIVNVKKITFIILIPLIILTLLYFYINHNITVSQTQFLMNTTIEIKLYGKNIDKQKLEKIINNTFDVIKEVEDNSTSYNEYTGNAASLNKNRGSYYQVNQELIDQLSISAPFYNLTGGEFNIGLFRTVNLWRDSVTTNTLPTKEQALNSLGASTPNDIFIDVFNSRIKIPPDMEIDLGAVSKGYSLDEAVKFLKHSGINKALINAGGNILALGSPDDRDYYTIAVQDPHNISRMIGTVKLKDNQVIATSGSYNRYYEFDGKKYSHIFSGTSGYPTDLYKSVTVLTNKGIISDILSTSLFLLSIEDGEKLISKINYPVEVLYVTNDDKIIKSEGFEIEFSQDNQYKSE